MPSRFKRPSLLLALGLAFAGGCSKKAKNDGAAKQSEPTTATSNVRGETPASSAAPSGNVETFVHDFLADVRTGKATPARLSTPFKKLIAPPRLDDDKTRGWSEWEAEQWLKEFAGKIATEFTLTPFTTADEALASATPKPASKPGRILLRIGKENGSFVVDFAHVSTSPSVDELTGTGDILLARFAASAFLETVLSKSNSLTETFLSAAGKAKIAPPLDDEDKTRGYSHGILQNKLSSFRGDAAGYTVTTRDISGNAATFKGELLGSSPRKFELRLAKGSSGWRVEEFEAVDK